MFAFTVYACDFKYVCLSVHMTSVCFSLTSCAGFNPVPKSQQIKKVSYWPCGNSEFKWVTNTNMWKWLHFDWILQWQDEQINSHMTEFCVCVCVCVSIHRVQWFPLPVVLCFLAFPAFPGDQVNPETQNKKGLTWKNKQHSDIKMIALCIAV